MKRTFLLSLTSLGLLTIAFSNQVLACNNAFAYVDNVYRELHCYTVSCPHFYVGAHIGVSHLHDKPCPGCRDSVDENGPGGTLLAGFQFDPLWGAELGYTQYQDSRETSGVINVAKTEHYAAYLAATGRIPLGCQLSVIGKFGGAYSYANKIFTATGIAGSSGAVSLYGGLGLEYSITRTVDLVAQWAGARGNNFTGSSELYSLGFNFAIV